MHLTQSIFDETFFLNLLRFSFLLEENLSNLSFKFHVLLTL